jgi:hypothetical protein
MVITIMTPYVVSLGGTQFYLGVLGSTSALIALIWNPIVVNTINTQKICKTGFNQCVHYTLIFCLKTFISGWQKENLLSQIKKLTRHTKQSFVVPF